MVQAVAGPELRRRRLVERPRQDSRVRSRQALHYLERLGRKRCRLAYVIVDGGPGEQGFSHYREAPALARLFGRFPRLGYSPSRPVTSVAISARRTRRRARSTSPGVAATAAS